MIVTFFGHRRVPSTLKPIVYSILCDLIENQNADDFYVGHNGEFDTLIKNALLQAKEKYQHIKFTIVLSHLAVKEIDGIDSKDTLYPDCFEKVPKRFAILSRNKWMIEKSDLVVAYVTNTVTNSAKFLEFAQKKGKKVINLAELL